ncbi:hypothetical protein [Asaia sp. HumB]|uniref:hypothetical protein n=1 Tax=Asaia sp. HumB TaxID=3035475 RepID=UPI00255555E7|nr:hypothetical protein [Asaia sp. HumB]MDL2169772.1 hypothetical protein [Asaia sp. HumB]
MSDTATARAARLPRSFTQKKIRVTFTVASRGLGNGSTSDEVTLEGYRCQIEVLSAGLRVGQSCNLRIYGVSLPIMNRLSMLAYPIDPVYLDAIRTTYNTVRVEAGDDETGLATIYYGIISEAFADFSSIPEPAFQVYSQSVQGPNVAIVPAQTYKAGTSIAEIISNLAAQSGYTFVNYGLNARLPADQYLHGTLDQQIGQLYKAFKFIHTIRNGEATASDTAPRYQVTVWSRNLQDIQAAVIPKISARTGLIGYPSYNSSGIYFTTLFDRRLQFMAPIEVDSSYLPEAWVNNQSGQVAPIPVNGTWIPSLVAHELDAEIPNGRWFTRVEAVRADKFGAVKAPTS